jgi:hypothetical protein
LKGVYTKDVPLDDKGHPILAKCKLTPTQNEIIRLAAALKARSRSRSSSDYTSTSGSESEDSVDEFYRANPGVPKFSELVKVRNPSPRSLP